MKSLIKILFFDSGFVKKLKQNKTHNSYLHNMLLEGKITLREYLRTVKQNMV